MVLNNTQKSCNHGVSQKCAGCNMRFVCDKSPFCTVANVSDNFEAISKYLNGFYNQYQTTLDAEREAFTQMQQSASVQDMKLSELKEDYSNKYTELNSKVERILAILENVLSHINTSNINATDNILTTDNVDEPIIAENSALELYNGDKKYVEKKTLFGKTKWVEDK